MSTPSRTLAMGQDEAPDSNRPTVEAPFGRALTRLGEVRPDVVGLTADLGKYTDILPFRDAFPERFFNVGMAEQNLVAVAAGLARTGFVPFATTYGVFATRRAFDFVAIACAHSNLNVKIIEAGSYHRLWRHASGNPGSGSDAYDPRPHYLDPCDATNRSSRCRDRRPSDRFISALLRIAVPVVLDAGYRFEIGKLCLRDGKDVGIISRAHDGAST